MARRKMRSTSLAERINALETQTWENTGRIIRRLGIEVSWAKIANVMISSEGVESSNFVTGSAGWQINGDGVAEFQDVTIRGTLNADDITVGTLSAARIATNSLSVDKISGGTYGNSDIIFNSGSDLISSNYSAGSDGWKINGNGVVEFQDATIRGTLNASDLSAGTLSASRIAANSLSISKISGGTYGNADITFSSGSDLISSNFSAGSAGWKIEGNGDAEFNDVTVRGTIFATAGEIGGLSITGNITLGSGGVIRTATSGARVEMVNSAVDRVQWFSGHASEAIEGHITTGTGTNLGFLSLVAVVITAGGSSVLNLITDSTAGGSMDFLSSASTNTFNFWAASTKRVTIDSAGLTMNSGVVKLVNGSSGSPSLTFNSDTNTGFYHTSTADQIGFIAAGTLQALLHNQGLRGSSATGSFWLRSLAGAENLPTYAFQGDTNTGFFRAAADTIGVALGGNEHFTFDPTGAGFFGIGDDTPDASLDVFSNSADTPVQIFRNTGTSTNRLFEARSNWSVANQVQAQLEADGDWFNRNGTYGTISDARLKTDIVDARDYSDDLRDFRPQKFIIIGQTKPHLGYIAQQVQQVKPDFVSTTTLREFDRADDGTKTNYREVDTLVVKTSLMIPVLHSGWLAHDDRLEKLENQMKELVNAN